MFVCVTGRERERASEKKRERESIKIERKRVHRACGACWLERWAAFDPLGAVHLARST